MRRTTALSAQWEADSQSGETLHFECCKGGYFSTKEEYGFKVVGKTAQPSLIGKNLFQASAIVASKIINNEGICPWGSGWCISDYIPVVGGQTYVKSGRDAWSSATYDKNFAFFDENKTFLETIFANDCVVTAPSLAHYVVLCDMVLDVDKVMFETGTQPSAYEPYCGGIPSPNPLYPQPIQCVKAGTVIRIQDENENTISQCTTPCDLYEGDVWYPQIGKVERYSDLIALTGGEEWFENPSSNYAYRYQSFSVLSTPKNTKVTCNIYQNAEVNNEAPLHSIGIHTSLTKKILVVYSDQINVNDLKAFLSNRYANGNPCVFVYERETPTIEQYEPQPAFAQQGVVNVLQVQTELSADLSATLLKMKRRS